MLYLAKYYDQKQYNKAIPYFERQAAWTQFCQFNAEDSNNNTFNDRDIALAQNNVGLSYAKLGKPLWARAWFLLTPDSKVSQYNLKQLNCQKSQLLKALMSHRLALDNGVASLFPKPPRLIALHLMVIILVYVV
jgi:hypothetical protein